MLFWTCRDYLLCGPGDVINLWCWGIHTYATFIDNPRSGIISVTNRKNTQWWILPQAYGSYFGSLMLKKCCCPKVLVDMRDNEIQTKINGSRNKMMMTAKMEESHKMNIHTTAEWKKCAEPTSVEQVVTVFSGGASMRERELASFMNYV